MMLIFMPLLIALFYGACLSDVVA